MRCSAETTRLGPTHSLNSNSDSLSAMADHPESSPSPSPPSPITIDGSERDLALSKSNILSRREVLERRSRHCKQLARLYRKHYWVIMDMVKHKHRDYYWTYGKSPFKDNSNSNSNCPADPTATADNPKLGLGFDNTTVGDAGGDEIKRCQVNGCKTKAMALTRFCHVHILSDPKQKLYKACNGVLKRLSMQAGPLRCNKPILRSTVPSLCPTHYQKNEKYLIRDLKKAGLNVSSVSKLAPKFHVIVAEYISQIQTKRRAAQKAILGKVEQL